MVGRATLRFICYSERLAGPTRPSGEISRTSAAVRRKVEAPRFIAGEGISGNCESASADGTESDQGDRSGSCPRGRMSPAEAGSEKLLAMSFPRPGKAGAPTSGNASANHRSASLHGGLNSEPPSRHAVRNTAGRRPRRSGLVIGKLPHIRKCAMVWAPGTARRAGWCEPTA